MAYQSATNPANNPMSYSRYVFDSERIPYSSLNERLRILSDLNDRGVQELIHDRPQRALKVFLEGIQECNTICTDISITLSWEGKLPLFNPDFSPVDTTQGLEEFSCQSVPWQSCGFQEFTSIAHRTSPGNMFEMYYKPFIFDGVTDTFSGPVIVLAAFTHLTAVFSFNAALLHHVRGLKTGDISDMRMALQLYTDAYNRLQNTASIGLYSHHFNLMLLALLNNLAFLHSYFWNLHELWVYREQYLSFFVYTTSNASREDYVFFYMNLLLSNNSPKNAPAA